MTDALDGAGVRRAYQHVFLPPKLPHAADDNFDQLTLVRYTRETIVKLRDDLPVAQKPVALNRAIASLDSLLAINRGASNSIVESELLQHITALSRAGISANSIVCYVAKQNAAVLVTRTDSSGARSEVKPSNKIIFEAFELSPSNQAVYQQAGRLRRTFPGSAVAIDLDKRPSADFAPAVAAMLSKMSDQAVEGMQPKTRKARSDHDEERDTTNPAAVTDLFIGLLRSFGEPVLVDSISKNTREEVLWHNALAPWRRSPVWLLIRIAMQLVITRAPDGSCKMYKQVIAFVMSQILSRAQTLDFASEDLHVMNAKIAARTIKLAGFSHGEASLHPSVLQNVENTLKSSAELIDERWSAIQGLNSRQLDMNVLSRLDFEADVCVALPDLDRYLHQLRDKEGRQGPRLGNNFEPKSTLLSYDKRSIPHLPSNDSDPLAYAAAHRFEDWVGQCLSEWVDSSSDENASRQLRDLMRRYHSLAAKLYAMNPEATSTMVLTLFELFVACDRTAIKECDLLKRFDHGIPQHVLQNLLLPTLDGLERLSAIETYLSSRSVQAVHKSESLFDLEHTTGFAYQYFEQSSELKSLHAKIERQAAIDKDAKRTEYRQMHDEYLRIKTLHDQSQCEYKDVIIDDWCNPPETERRHVSGCRKCSYQRQMSSMSIAVFEEPLPGDDVKAMSVVFELAVPDCIASWRDARHYLLMNMLNGKCTSKNPSASYKLSNNDPHLTYRHYVSGSDHRIDLLSEAKPVVKSHYSTKKISQITEASVIMANGLFYEYWDSDTMTYIDELSSSDQLAKSCTYTLPVPTLQHFLTRNATAPDGRPPNTVIASLDKCPDDMSLEEYKELTSLPLGRHIQWANMELQLAMPSVDFKKQLTTLVFLQCIHQAGPPSRDALRDCHNVLHNDSKVASVLQHLEEAIDRVKQNWESAEALGTFTAIAVRLLEVNKSAEKRCLEILSKIRTIAVQWMHTLCDRAHASEKQEHRTAFVVKSVETALLCSYTYEVDAAHLQTVLSDADNASCLIQAAVVIQQGEPSHPWADLHSNLLRFRHKRLLLRCYPMLSANQAGLNLALVQTWSKYAPGPDGWSPAPKPADHWVITTTDSAMQVHVNLLDGEIRVNGAPLGLIPIQYRDQALYHTLFAKAAIEIMPAPDRNFNFSTKRAFSGRSVQLALRAADQDSSVSELIVQASEGSRSYETVPSRLFKQLFPDHYVNSYVHWYDATSNTVHFRTCKDPWNADTATGWVLTPANPGSGWTLSRSGESVVGLLNRTSKEVCRQLHPLADPHRIHCVVRNSASILNIDIPSLRLGFLLCQGETTIASREYRGMTIDPNQTIATLVGLKNLLVLKTEHGKRLILLPEGRVAWDSHRGHVAVTVVKSSISKIHAVEVDLLLQGLKDSGDMQGKLFLAYLHALTSHCCPDPLTGQTGTEQALTILRSGAVRSFDRLTQDNANMLGNIARLTPERSFYPTHERVMQTVSWIANLSFISQHAALNGEVQAMFAQAQRTSIFAPVPDLPCPLTIENSLSKRYMNRSSQTRVANFGAEISDRADDGTYASRDAQSARGMRSAEIAHLLLRNGDDHAWPRISVTQLWQEIQAVSAVKGLTFHATDRSVRYDGTHVAASSHVSALEKLPSLIRLLQEEGSRSTDRMYHVAGWLAALAFSVDCNLGLLQLFVQAFKGTFAGVSQPTWQSCSPSKGKDYLDSIIRTAIDRQRSSMASCPEQNMERRVNEKRKNYDNRRRNAWTGACRTAKELLVSRIVSQWPCRSPGTPDAAGIEPYYNVAGAMTAVRGHFEAWYDNGQLYHYLEELTSMTSSNTMTNVQLAALQRAAPNLPRSVRAYVSESDLFNGSAPTLQMAAVPKLEIPRETTALATSHPEQLKVATFAADMQSKVKASSAFEQSYISDLIQSSEALELHDRAMPGLQRSSGDLEEHLEDCKQQASKWYSQLAAAVQRTPHTCALTVRQWPRLSSRFFLKQLSRANWMKLSKDWKAAIVAYALTLATLQRAARLAQLQSSSRLEDLANELQNCGHTNWNPLQYPETLLIEVESGFLVRPIQEDIAAQMRGPSNSQNAVMQLNMGEGKSSVIVPMVAAALADAKQLVRVIVAKPQSKQMAQMLISKLGGLVDRRIYYMPFSRSIKLDESAANLVHNMLRECMRSGGILMVQPEHILSLKLAAPECYATGRPGIGKSLMATQDFFDACARDIVDESDENFSVHFELIYTMGMQSSIEGSPDRWFIIQQVLELVAAIAPSVLQKCPKSLEILESSPGCFPRIRILGTDAEETLVSQLAKHIRDHGIDGLQLSRQSEEMRHAVYEYMTCFELNDPQIDAVESSTFWTDLTRPTVLLLRGIFAGGILAFVLRSKRWRVNYGLADRDPSTKLAVPYRAKDSPSPRSEFSHPDVVLSLTLLCYYYEGTTDDDLFTSLAHLMDSDQADAEYQAWIKGVPDLPTAFHQLQGINLEDRLECVTRLFPHLHRLKRVADYFLSHIVFPKEMKQFPHKLSASGWDIGKVKGQLTTGFSGTNDSRCLLPLDISHLDLADQKHTNALVLNYLLRAENSVQMLTPTPKGSSGAHHFLDTVRSLSCEVQVILDVGAQILELNNSQVAQTWLEASDTSKEAAVFVSDSDDLCVVDRSGRVDLLQTSPFASRLDACLVFLDESHTRGIDLKLPSHYRAAVTLGANLTKDRLVQACMRMRKLGKGQTVVFCISDEIRMKIESVKPDDHSSTIGVSDVLCWSIFETFSEIRRSMPLWATQGERFVRHSKLWQAASDQGKTSLTKAHAEQFLEDEAQSLETRYRPQREKYQPAYLSATQGSDMKRIADRCSRFDNLQVNASTLQEEQERELSPEIEQERQIEKVPAAEPHRHALHIDVRNFALNGSLKAQSSGYMAAWSILSNITAATCSSNQELARSSQYLLATADFATTVKSPSAKYMSDYFQRPVQWLLTRRESSSNNIDRVMIISSYEANLLYPLMKNCKTTAIHLYKPRSNLGYAPLTLGFHTVPGQPTSTSIPRSLNVQLNLFAGQLYITSYEDYLEICNFLGLATERVTAEMSARGWKVGPDGFIISDESGRTGGSSGLAKSPTAFLKALMSKVRRNGFGIAKTHMGSLLEGKLFDAAEFEE